MTIKYQLGLLNGKVIQKTLTSHKFFNEFIFSFHLLHVISLHTICSVFVKTAVMKVNPLRIVKLLLLFSPFVIATFYYFKNNWYTLVEFSNYRTSRTECYVILSNAS